MSRLLDRLHSESFTLVVSLPRNDVRLAEAALRGGAQGLKVHINVHHHASGTHFGPFEEERYSLARILEAAGPVPVGVVPGGTPFARCDEFDEMARLGMDFFDAYPADAPAWTLSQQSLGRMLAAFHGVSPSTMQSLERLGMQMCEASIVPQEEYGNNLAVLDLARYHELAQALNVPVIVPTQKRIAPDDVALLRATGARGLLIGAVVTGPTEEGVEAATRSFRAVMD